MKLLVLRSGLLVIYLLALIGLAGLEPAGFFVTMQVIAVALLVIHALELLFAFKYLRFYRGPLAMSVLLTLLYGLFHWKPLADAHAEEQVAKQRV